MENNRAITKDKKIPSRKKIFIFFIQAEASLLLLFVSLVRKQFADDSRQFKIRHCDCERIRAITRVSSSLRVSVNTGIRVIWGFPRDIHGGS